MTGMQTQGQERSVYGGVGGGSVLRTLVQKKEQEQEQDLGDMGGEEDVDVGMGSADMHVQDAAVVEKGDLYTDKGMFEHGEVHGEELQRQQQDQGMRIDGNGREHEVDISKVEMEIEGVYGNAEVGLSMDTPS